MAKSNRLRQVDKDAIALPEGQHLAAQIPLVVGEHHDIERLAVVVARVIVGNDAKHGCLLHKLTLPAFTGSRPSCKIRARDSVLERTAPHHSSDPCDRLTT